MLFNQWALDGLPVVFFKILTEPGEPFPPAFNLYAELTTSWLHLRTCAQTRDSVRKTISIFPNYFWDLFIFKNIWTIIISHCFYTHQYCSNSATRSHSSTSPNLMWVQQFISSPLIIIQRWNTTTALGACYRTPPVRQSKLQGTAQTRWISLLLWYSRWMSQKTLYWSQYI